MKQARDLTAQELRRTLDYNPENGVFTWLTKNTRHNIGDRAGAPTHQGYIRIGFNSRRYLGHHLAWLYMTGMWAKEDVDHKDLDRANNRWGNLRQASRSQNLANSPKRLKNTSGFKGVSWAKRERKWMAYIKVNYKHIWLGGFATPEDAHAAYVAAAQERFGEFARAD